MMCLWAIWTERNAIISKGSTFNPLHVVQLVIALLEDYKKLHLVVTQTKHHLPAFSQCPPTRRLKINVDGSFKTKSGKWGIGVVVTNDVEECIVALPSSFSFVSSVLHMEAEAYRVGFLIATQIFWSTIDIESDCAVLIFVVSNGKEDYSEVRQIISDCVSYQSAINFCQVSHF